MFVLPMSFSLFVFSSVSFHISLLNKAAKSYSEVPSGPEET